MEIYTKSYDSHSIWFSAPSAWSLIIWVSPAVHGEYARIKGAPLSFQSLRFTCIIDISLVSSY